MIKQPSKVFGKGVALEKKRHAEEKASILKLLDDFVQLKATCFSLSDTRNSAKLLQPSTPRCVPFAANRIHQSIHSSIHQSINP